MHDEVFEDIWMNEKYDRLDYVKNGALSTAFGCAKYSRGLQKSQDFG